MEQTEKKEETEDVKAEPAKIEEDSKPEILDPNDVNLNSKTEEPEPDKYFECNFCHLKEKYEYFGREPPFLKKIKILEDSYVIEDPFQAPKQGEILILGAHCIRCQNSFCKDTNCSIYFDGTYCIKCAKSNLQNFPDALKEKLNRIVEY